ncbi:MAG: GHMP kinase [Nitrospinae bacterium]|nr:GHMP kinase [Nitrospinota bacterium]
MKPFETVDAVAPTRIDLAGGTLDIWPLNLFFEGAVTINMAISIKTTATVTPRDDGKIVLVSEDTNHRVDFADIDSINHHHPLGLLSRLLEHFAHDDHTGAQIVTRSEAPAGAGLAGSSALNIALCGALAKATGRKVTKEKLIQVAKDVEAALLRTPTGLQDYAAAVYGSVNAFHFPAGGMVREKLDNAGPWLARHVLLFYSGKSRSSGINNWEMFKRVVEKDNAVVKKFDKITTCALRALIALREDDYAAFEKAVGDEWNARRSLFPEISTPVIDRAIASAMKNGARSARICGAGGGGCFFVTAEPHRQQEVIRAVTAEGATHLPFGISRTGLKVYNQSR